jgi:LmbE family N-acetylglucosaminyl deacetylase
MKLSFQNERVLAVVAHPDDAELLCAGTLARARSDGAAIAICVLCRGDKGRSSKPMTNLTAVRRKEMSAAAKLLGAELFPGDNPDGVLADAPAQRLKLVETYRQFKPTLVLAHPLEDYHPDHRAAAMLAEAATWFSASRGDWTRSPALASPPALWWMDTLNMNAFEPQFYVNISRHLSLKLKMLGCHKSQLMRANDPEFTSLTDLLRRQAQARGSQAGVAAAEAFRAHNVFKRARAW